MDLQITTRRIFKRTLSGAELSTVTLDFTNGKKKINQYQAIAMLDHDAKQKVITFLSIKKTWDKMKFGKCSFKERCECNQKISELRNSESDIVAVSLQILEDSQSGVTFLELSTTQPK